MMKKFFYNESFLRITSVLIAVLLWMYVIGARNPSVDVTFRGIPINIINSANISGHNLKIISMSAKTADVRVTGRRSDVANVTSEDITLNINAEAVDGPAEYYLKIAASVNTTGVSVAEISVDSVNVYVDYIAANEKNVEIKVKGEVKNGYIAGEYSVENDSVIIQGPQNVIDSIGSAVATIDVSGASADIAKLCPIVLYDLSGEEIDLTYIELSHKDVSVRMPVYKTKTVPVKPVFSGVNGQNTVTSKVTPESVTVYGEDKYLAEIDFIETEQVNAGGAAGVDRKVNVALKKPTGVSFINVEGKVTVEFRKELSE